jgi:hypothetical protein
MSPSPLVVQLVKLAHTRAQVPGTNPSIKKPIAQINYTAFYCNSQYPAALDYRQHNNSISGSI